MSRSTRNETSGTSGPFLGRRCSCPPGANGPPGPAGLILNISMLECYNVWNFSLFS